MWKKIKQELLDFLWFAIKLGALVSLLWTVIYFLDFAEKAFYLHGLGLPMFVSLALSGGFLSLLVWIVRDDKNIL